jgi:glycosyltransferase involved in cell wall biosynthesis
MRSPEPVLSVVVPFYNEAASLPQFYHDLSAVMHGFGQAYEIIFINDGSRDTSLALLTDLAKDDHAVRILSLTRNFGKEVATTAGIHAAKGQAVLTLDADGQHPVSRIPAFVSAWNRGAKVVIGRHKQRQAGVLKRILSKLFYTLFSRLTGVKLDANTSDFRLIDRNVQQQFNLMTERRRITRGLIDWMGYERVFVSYDEKPRLAGSASYSFPKLFKLAIDSVISLSVSPLYITAYIGAFVLPIATLLGFGMTANYVLGDPLHLHATGGAYLMVLILFLMGILLVSQGIIGLYLSHIHTETQNRPLYLIDESHSKGLL